MSDMIKFASAISDYDHAFEEALSLVSYNDLETMMVKKADAISGIASALGRTTQLGKGARLLASNPKALIGGGAAIGAAGGFLNPGFDPQTGMPRSSIGGAIKGGLKGAVGGAALHGGARLGLGAASSGMEGVKAHAGDMAAQAKNLGTKAVNYAKGLVQPQTTVPKVGP